MDAMNLFASREEESKQRIFDLRTDLGAELATVERHSEDPEVCIYATGSLARLEATEHSDLDAFFFLSGSSKKNCLSRIRDVKILNCVVTSAEERGFPDFSNDGEFLKFLHIDDVIDHIGSREDDYYNALTARMLMILESTHLYNESLFKNFRTKVIESYFRDFHDHSKSFRPVFLLNDILRFWRTLCLNYENGREWREQSSEKSAKGHLSNLKLRFSRLNICYSFIAHLLSKGGSLSPDHVIDTAELTPLHRLRDLSDQNEDLREEIYLLQKQYAWFLDKTGRSKESVLSWIADEQERIEAFSESQKFVDTMANVVRKIAEKNGYLRYLII